LQALARADPSKGFDWPGHQERAINVIMKGREQLNSWKLSNIMNYYRFASTTNLEFLHILEEREKKIHEPKLY